MFYTLQHNGTKNTKNGECFSHGRQNFALVVSAVVFVGSYIIEKHHEIRSRKILLLCTKRKFLEGELLQTRI